MPIVEVSGYDEAKKIISVMTQKRFFVYLRGSNNADSQQSWCPDCAKCDTTVYSVLRNDDQESLVCNVGFKAEWLDPECPFRTDAKFQVTTIPTLLNFATGERITDENKLAKADVVKAFLH